MNSFRSVQDFVFSLLLVFGILGLAYGQFQLIGSSLTTTDISWQPWWLFAGGFSLALVVFRRVIGQRFVATNISRSLLILGILVVLLTDISQRRFAFYSGGDAKYFVMFFGVILVALHLLRWRYEQVEDGLLRFFSLPLVLFFQGLIGVLFILLANGRVLFSDDHPSFWYRFYLLNQKFPSIPFYSPAWEAGYSAREFFASGILNVYFLSAPFWLLGPDLSDLSQAPLYNYIIVYVFVFLLPLSVYLATRLLSLSKPVAAIAALLAIGPTIGQFEWLLKYGTLGFCCSVGFLPLAIALIYRLAFSEHDPKKRDVVGLLCVSFLVVSWSLSVLALIPAVLIGLLYWRESFASNRRKLVLIFAAMFLCVNLPWVKIFVEESKVFSFVSKTALPGAVQDDEAALGDKIAQQDRENESQKPEKARKASFSKEYGKELLRSARSLIAKVNPLIIVLILPGVLLLEKARMRQLFVWTILFLMFLAFFGEAIKPQLELRRMIIPAAYLCCIPVALAIEYLIREISIFLFRPRFKVSRLRRCLEVTSLLILSGALIYSPISVAAVFQNRTDEQFKFAPDHLGDLSLSIKEHAGTGRMFFLGFVLHEFGATNYRSQDGGHVAILAALTGVPMYAHYYYHSHWQTIDPIPRHYRDRGEEGIEEFLDLLNVTSVITSRKEWMNYCRARRAKYTEVAVHGRFRIFTRVGDPNGYLVSGSADVLSHIDGLSITPHTNEVRLKFRHLPKLRSSNTEGVKLFAYPAFVEDTGTKSSREVDFLGLKVSDKALGREIRISY